MDSNEHSKVFDLHDDGADSAHGVGLEMNDG
jgi:hypothetical protein